MDSLPQLIFDVVTKTALLLHGDQAISLKGTYASTSEAHIAAVEQFPLLFGPSNLPLEPPDLMAIRCVGAGGVHSHLIKFVRKY